LPRVTIRFGHQTQSNSIISKTIKKLHMVTSLKINLIEFLRISIGIFSIGTFGLVLNRKNIILAIMSLELLLLAVYSNLFIETNKTIF